MKVVLETAWAWDCPNCSARNYSESNEEKITSGDVQAMGFDQSEEGESWLLAPDNIMCPECRQAFETTTNLEGDMQP